MADTTFKFETWTDYRAAVLRLLAAAQSSLCIYDPDLTATGLASPAGAQALKDLALRSSREDAIRILLKDCGPLQREQPRLLQLITTHSHRIMVRQAPPDSLPMETWMIADGRHMLLRFHEDMARGWCASDDSRAPARYAAQFETIWQRSQPASTGAPLGL